MEIPEPNLHVSLIQNGVSPSWISIAGFRLPTNPWRFPRDGFLIGIGRFEGQKILQIDDFLA